jgi:hypothetical protein
MPNSDFWSPFDPGEPEMYYYEYPSDLIFQTANGVGAPDYAWLPSVVVIRFGRVIVTTMDAFEQEKAVSASPTDQLDNWFTYHPPVDEKTANSYVQIRSCARAFAHLIDELSPDGIEKDEALKALHSSVMWANSGIACSGE